MSDSFAFRRFGVSAAAVLALALSACGGGGGGGSAAELAAAPASAGGAAPVDGRSAAAGAPPGAGEGAGSPPVEERLSVAPGAGEAGPGAEAPGPGVPVGEAPGAGAGAPAAPGGESTLPGAAMWHVFGEVGTGEGAAALVTSDELAALPTRMIGQAAASGSWPSQYGVRVKPARPSPEFDVTDAASGLRHWTTYRGEWVHAGADSGMTQSAGALLSWSRPLRGEAVTSVGLGHDEHGAVTYRIANSSQDWRARSFHTWTLDSEAEGVDVRKWSSGGGKGAVFRREDSEGNLWAIVTTDISGAGDTDWLATGMWAYTPADGAVGKYRFGVFADGGEGFERYGSGFNMDYRLTGVGRYAGGASGLYTRVVDGARKTDFFEADVTLIASFGNHGTICPGPAGFPARSAASRSPARPSRETRC